MKSLTRLTILIALIFAAAQAGFSRGDKIIPQVVDGPDWRTNFDLTNVGSRATITNMYLRFYKNDGTAWTLQTNQGTGSSFRLTIGPRQTLRVVTSGAASLAQGYAVITDEESGNSEYSDDYSLGISVFYTYSIPDGVVDTITVSVPQLSAAVNAPMQMADSNGIYSGIAFVNRSGESSDIFVTLYSGDTGLQYGDTKKITLDHGKEWSGYLDNADLFPGLKSFHGMAQIVSTKAISLLALLQTRSADGSPRYSTLVPVDRESLRRNTNMVMLQASDNTLPYMPIDIDSFVVDYARIIGDPDRGDTESYSWDLEYRFNAPDGTSRYMAPVSENGVGIASIGYRDNGNFDALSLPTLKSLTYSTSATIDLSNDRNSSLYTGYTFAVRTDVGNYAKLRIVRIIDTVDGSFTNNKDLVLEVVVYR